VLDVPHLVFRVPGNAAAAAAHPHIMQLVAFGNPNLKIKAVPLRHHNELLLHVVHNTTIVDEHAETEYLPSLR
jgi:hypothetical protein